ncbi:putative oxidoreductase SadH [Posidoniimonas corsicana]|uniref:Putative oxidoreductase SadH n=1 Tax=Posidoniimonas corsicana TaxID=1938618 RepID=A0A5C5UYL1_9BACT|nr:putative oxidoreductase SadH [Posidoniimonas corsicana]
MPRSDSQSDGPAPTGYAVVTGASSGIGRAISEHLQSAGWQVARVDCNPGSGPAADSTRLLDVSQQEAWLSLESDLRERWPRIDLLVNCAGVLVGGDLVDCPLEAVTRVADVNVKGVLIGCRVLGTWLIESGPQRPAGLRPRAGIINVSSIFAAVCPPGFAAYNASKAAVLALSESLRGELAPHGLNVTVAAPGVVRTPLFRTCWFATDAYRSAAGRFYELAQLEPGQVAAAALAAAERGKLLCVVGGRARRLWLLKRLFPCAVQRYAARRSRRELGSPSPPAEFAASTPPPTERDTTQVG